MWRIKIHVRVSISLFTIPAAEVVMLVSAFADNRIDNGPALRKHWAEVIEKILFMELKAWTKKSRSTMLNVFGLMLYDCYAVSNDYKRLGGGHSRRLDWNKDGNLCHFDGSVVKEVDDAAAVSKAAYVLYYRRREQKKITNASEERLTHDSEFKYSLSPVSITTDASSSGSLDEILDAPYQNESNDFAV